MFLADSITLENGGAGPSAAAPLTEREGRVAAILDKMTGKTWKQDRAAALAVLAG